MFKYWIPEIQMFKLWFSSKGLSKAKVSVSKQVTMYNEEVEQIQIWLIKQHFSVGWHFSTRLSQGFEVALLVLKKEVIHYNPIFQLYHQLKNLNFFVK